MKKIVILLLLIYSVTIFSETTTPFDVSGNKYIIRPFYGVARAGKFYELICYPQSDPNKGRIEGIQIERYVYKDVLNYPINITFQSSFIVHENRYVGKENNYYTNKNSNEINFGIKIYWTKFPWDSYVRTRLGVSEGASYIDRIANIERSNQYKGKNSNILNYIDLTLSFNLKDLTTLEFLENSYVGTGVSHRSDIFGTINHINGGSNKITMFFETEL